MTDVMHEVMQDAVGPQNPLEALRARRQEIADKTEVFIGIPGYEEMGLKAKYRLLSRDDTERIAKNVRGQVKGDRSEFMYRVILDTTIAACEGFYLAADGVPDEEASPLQDAEGDHITSFLNLARSLGWEPPSERAGQRAATIWVFGDNEFAVGSHGLILQRWLNNTNSEVNVDFLGD